MPGQPRPKILPTLGQRGYRINQLPHREALALAWPMIVSNISVPLMGIADTAMLGHLEKPLFLAAVALASSIIAFMYWAFAFLRMGTTSFTARALGAEDYGQIAQLLRQYMLIAASIGVTIFALKTISLPFAFWLIAPEPSLLEHAQRYCDIRIFSAPAVLLTYVMVGWLIGMQDTKAALWVAIIPNILNILLDYLFIFVFDLAAEGAAYATLIAELCACAIAAAVVFYKGRKMQLWSRARQEHGSRRNWSELLSLNTDLFIRTASLLFVFSFFNAQSAQLGQTVLAANAIIIQLVLFGSFCLDGYAHAAEAMTAKAIGAGRTDDFHRASLASALPALLIAALLSLTFYFAGHVMIAAISDIEEIQSTVAAYLPWLIAFPLVGVWCYLLDGIFIGVGKTKTLRNLMLISTFIVYLPTWWFTQPLGNHGLWLAFLLFHFSRAATLLLSYGLITRRHRW